MHVKYHQLVSQDLLSLKTLSDAHDVELDRKAEAEGRPRPAKQPLRLEFKGLGPTRRTCDLELPMSPIANPSALELLDTSTATESLYPEQPPRVSTMKKPEVLLLDPYSGSNTTLPSGANKREFSLNHHETVDSIENFTAFPESLFFTRKQHAKPLQTNSLLFSTHGSKMMSSSNTSFPAVSRKTQRQQQCQGDRSNISLDSEKPILPSLAAKAPRPSKKPCTSYSWESTNWYGDDTAGPSLQTKKRKVTESSFHDREVRNACVHRAIKV